MAALDGLPAFHAHTRLLVVAPHPDDETIATGVLIQQVRAAGGEVRILLLTAGDNNPWPQRWLERRLWVGAEERRRWGQRRRAEVQQALAALGLPVAVLEYLGWPDLGVTGRLLRSTASAIAAIAEAVSGFSPDLIALPALRDRHPDHGSTHVLVRLALAGQAESPALLAYLVHGEVDASRCMEMRATPAQLAKKQAALLAHASQIALSGGRMQQLATRPERYTGVELALHQSPAVLPWHPPAWLGPWLRLSVVDSKSVQSWIWSKAPLRRSPDGRFQLMLRDDGQRSPRFARLSLGLPSPWIFDHWGWCELGVCSDRADAGVVPPG